MLAAASPFFMSGEEGGREHRDFCDHVRVPSVYSVPCIFASPAARSNRFRSPRFFRNNCSPQRHRDTEENMERKTQGWTPPRHSSCLEKRGGREHRDFCDHVRVPSVYSVPLYLCEPGRKVEPVPISEILPE